MRSTHLPKQQIDLVNTFADQAVIAIENVRLFDEIQDKSRQLAEASQHKSQFLASMSHELRTPLNAILGYTELIADGIYGAPPEKMQAVLKRVESNGRHLLGLINAVLDLSKIEAGQFTLDLADYSLQNVAQTVYNAVEPLAARQEARLQGRGAVRPALRPWRRTPADAGAAQPGRQRHQVHRRGEVVIKAGASNGNGSFELSVRDTGPGISAADQAKLFQEFQQADNPNDPQEGGHRTGARHIQAHHRDARRTNLDRVHSSDKGSTFFVILPAQAQEQAKPIVKLVRADVGYCAGFRTPAWDAIHALRRPASEKRQGRKSREVGHWRCRGCYGDLAAGFGLMRLDRIGCRDRFSAKPV